MEFELFYNNDDVKGLKQYLKTKKLNNKLMNGIFMSCCLNGKFNIVKWIVTNYQNIYTLKYEQGFKNAIRTNNEQIPLYLLKILYENVCDFDDLFAFSCVNDKLTLCKEIYKYGYVHTTPLYNPKTKKIKKYGLIRSESIITYLNNVIQEEIINDEFVQICNSNNLNDIRKFYTKNKSHIILSYKIHCVCGIFCLNNNDECIKWLLSLYTPPPLILIRSLIKIFKHDNINMVQYINNTLKSKKIMTPDLIDAFYGFLLDEKEYHIIIKIHDILKYKISCINVLLECITDIGSIDDQTHHKYFKRLYIEYIKIFEQDNEFKKLFFKHCCQSICVTNIEWLHKMVKLFDSPTDNFYLKCISASCETFNVGVAEWLTDLYNEYEINILEFMTGRNLMDVYVLYCKLSETRKLYKKISNGLIPFHESCKSLNITKMTPPNQTNHDQCVICMESPRDLILLNCNHYSCITCLCSWFINQEPNKESTCSCCKSSIIWPECKILRPNIEKDMSNIYESIKLTDEHTQHITNKYNELKKL